MLRCTDVRCSHFKMFTGGLWEMFTGVHWEMFTSGQVPPHWQGEGTLAVASAARGAPTSSTSAPLCVHTRPQRDPGISRDPGIDLESRSRDFGKSNPGIFRDLSYQTKQWFQRLLLGFDPNLSKKSRDENVRLIPSRKIPGSHQSRDEKSRLIPSRKIPGSRDFAKIPSRKSRD